MNHFESFMGQTQKGNFVIKHKLWLTWMCFGLLLFGITEVPCCRPHWSRTCAGVLPFFLAMSATSGSYSSQDLFVVSLGNATELWLQYVQHSFKLCFVRMRAHMHTQLQSTSPWLQPVHSALQLPPMQTVDAASLSQRHAMATAAAYPQSPMCKKSFMQCTPATFKWWQPPLLHWLWLECLLGHCCTMEIAAQHASQSTQLVTSWACPACTYQDGQLQASPVASVGETRRQQ